MPGRHGRGTVLMVQRDGCSEFGGMACDDKAGGCASGGGLISPSLRGWGADSMHTSDKARVDSRKSRMRLQGRTGSLVAVPAN